MKKYILMAVASMSLVSCLDTVILPDDITVGEDFWQKKSDVALMVNAAYEGMTTEDVISRLIVWGDFRSDEMVQANVEGTIPDALAEVAAVSTQTTNTYAKWSMLYSVINKCNIVLEKASGVMSYDPNYTQGDYLSDRSQMLALRSLCYFYLVRNFRDVPYVETAYMSSSQERNFTQMAPDQVLQRCIASLEEAAGNAIKAQSYELGNWRRVGWFTQDGIYALLADIYLWRASVKHSASDYEKCVKYCDMIIASKKSQHKKGHNEVTEKDIQLADGSDAYSDLFVTQNAEESIFELQIRSNTALCKYFYKYGSNSSQNGWLQASTIFGLSSSATTVAQATGSQVFPSNDLRYYASIFRPASGAESYDIRKMISNMPLTSTNEQGRATIDRTYASLDQNYIIYRLSDVVLMKAEALTQLVIPTDSMTGTEKTAQDSINDILLHEAFDMVEAVNTRSIYPATSSDNLKWATLKTMKREGKDGMELLVLEERLRELCFEGKRWYDLLRYNYRHISGVNYSAILGNQAFSAIPANYNEMLSIMVRGKGSQGEALKSKMRNEAYLYMPIPNEDIILSPQLV